MRTQIFILLVVVSVGAGSARADLIWDSGHHIYSEGSEGFVTVNNDATATITDGSIHWLTGNNQSRLTLTGGTVTNLMMNDTSIAVIEDVYSFGEFWTHGNSSLALNGGEVHWISTFYNSSVVLSGGQLEGLFSQDQSHVEIRGGSITARLVAYESSVIDIFGYEFSYDSAGGQWDGGQLTGFWEDGTSFSIDMQNWNRENGVTFDHINLHVIPEPASIAFLGLGFCIARKRTHYNCEGE